MGDATAVLNIGRRIPRLFYICLIDRISYTAVFNKKAQHSSMF